MEKLLIYSKNTWVWTGGYATKDTAKAAGLRWNPDHRQWWTNVAEKAAKLREYADDAAIAAIDAALVAKTAAVEASRATDTNIEPPCPNGLSYLGYQKAGIAYAMNHPDVLIGDDMGLGKTIQAIGVINSDESIKSVLVICPASLRLNWRREMEKWLTRKLTIGIANGALPATDVVIINYDILTKHAAGLRAHEWGLLISDECHYVKNGKAQRTKALLGSGRPGAADRVEPIKARKRLFLTGTPILNRPIELWTLAHLLAPQVFKSWKYYAEHFCNGHLTRWGWDTSGASNLDELQRLLREQCMVRRLKSEVLTELPPKRRQLVALPANGCSALIAAETTAEEAAEARLTSLRAAVELAKSASEQDYDAAVEDLRLGQQGAFTEMSRLRHETALAKVPYAIEHIKDAAESGKIVVFAWHHDVIEGLTKGLADLNPVVLTGETAMAARQAAVDRFQTDPECRVFIGSITAAGVGLTLTASSHVVFVELDWVPGNLTQAEDRTHRIGQRDAVLVQHLVLDGSIDQRLAETIVAKQAVIEAALNGGGQSISDATKPIIMDPVEEKAPATKNTTRNKITEIAEKISTEEIEAAHEGLKRIAALDPDFARVQNRVGFSKVDGEIGHRLAECASLTPKQGALAQILCRKYRRQLA